MRDDYERRGREDHHASLRLWLRLLTCQQMIEQQIRGQLRTRFATTLPRFDLLAQLERTPAGLKMNELSRRLMVTGGNVTAITDQLEQEGLVERVRVEGDRRATRIRLTAKGAQSFRKMARQHEQWVIEAFSSLTDTQLQQLHTLLGKVKTGLLVSDAESQVA
jgi:DNA-binding MarR family transcriptional regulator